MKPVLVAVVRVSLALGALLLVVLLSGVGGILNRSRGGWVDFSNLTGHYWPAHLVERLVFGVPTGFLVVREECFGLDLYSTVGVAMLERLNLLARFCRMNYPRSA